MFLLQVKTCEPTNVAFPMFINNCNLTLCVLTKSFQGKLKCGVIGMNVSKYIF